MTRAQFIRLRRWPPDHAEAARRAGFYLEAIQTIHAWLETQLRDVLLLSDSVDDVRKRGDFQSAWDTSNQIPYTAAANAAFVSGLISKQTFEQLRSFNSVRNALVHKLLYEPHERAYEGMPRRKYTATFKRGIKLGYKLQRYLESRV